MLAGNLVSNTSKLSYTTSDYTSAFVPRVENLKVLMPFHWPALVTAMQLSVTLVVTVVLDPLGHPL
jgi:hypothetical protein